MENINQKTEIEQIRKLMEKDTPIDIDIVPEERIKLPIAQQEATGIDLIKKLNDRIDAMARFIKQTQNTQKKHRSDNFGNICKAMANAKAEFNTANKGGTGYGNRSFASLEDMLDVTADILKKYELDASFFLYDVKNDDGIKDKDGRVIKEYRLKLAITHSSNEWYEEELTLNEDRLKSMDFPKNIGGAEKYFRRYMFRALFNLADKD